VQNVARATYRAILEQRAKENAVDFAAGVATAITPMAFLETVMVKGYQTLVDKHIAVSYRDAMQAARMMADMGRIIEVVRTFIPCERWPRRAGGPTRRNPCRPADIAGG
jgi:hypothetical protein